MAAGSVDCPLGLPRLDRPKPFGLLSSEMMGLFHVGGTRHGLAVERTGRRVTQASCNRKVLASTGSAAAAADEKSRSHPTAPPHPHSLSQRLGRCMIRHASAVWRLAVASPECPSLRTRSISAAAEAHPLIWSGTVAIVRYDARVAKKDVHSGRHIFHVYIHKYAHTR